MYIFIYCLGLSHVMINCMYMHVTILSNEMASHILIKSICILNILIQL